LGDFNARLHGVLLGEGHIIGPRVYGRGLAGLIRPERGYGERTNRDLLIDIARSTGCGGQDLFSHTRMSTE